MPTKAKTPKVEVDSKPKNAATPKKGKPLDDEQLEKISGGITWDGGAGDPMRKVPAK